MENQRLWLEALAGLKALYDLAQGIPDYKRSLQHYMSDSVTIRAAYRANATYTTYSERDLRAILQQIQACRNKFIAEGVRLDRGGCLHLIFQEIKRANCGVLPEVDEWVQMYRQLNPKE
jgi:hypothetical protein